MKAVPPQFKTRYMFSVQAEIASYRLGESPEGSRIDIEYKPRGRVKTNANLFFTSWSEELSKVEAELQKKNRKFSLPSKLAERTQWLKENRQAEQWPTGLDWLGLEGEVISGSDWILVRKDGVAEMSGHATLREEKWSSGGQQYAGKEFGGNIINVELSTVADLGEAAVPSFEKMPTPAPEKPEKVYELWKSSHGESELRFALALRFAVADSTQPWAGPTYGSLEGFWRFKNLPRRQYAANVKAKLIDGLLQSLELDVWRIGFEELPMKWDETGPTMLKAQQP